MMEYFSADNAYVQQKKETCSFFQEAYIEIYYPEFLCSNPRL